AAAARTRTQRPGKHLAVHASELVVKPDFQILRRYRRPLLLRLEHTHRPTLEDYVHRATRLGSSRSLNLRIGIRCRRREQRMASSDGRWRSVSWWGSLLRLNCTRSSARRAHPEHHRSRSTGGLGRVRYGRPSKCTAGGVVPYAEQQPRLAGATVEQN